MLRYLPYLLSVAAALKLGRVPGGPAKGSVTAEKLCGKNALGCSFFDPDKKAGKSGIQADVVYTRQVNAKNRSKMTLDFCRDYCFQFRVYHFFIVFRGNDCACFSYDYAGTSAPLDKCNLPCNGNEGEICGGTNAGNVYKLVKVVPPVIKAKCPGDVADEENAWSRDDGEALSLVIAQTSMQFVADTDCATTTLEFKRVADLLHAEGKGCTYWDAASGKVETDMVVQDDYEGSGQGGCRDPFVDMDTPGTATMGFWGWVPTGPKDGKNHDDAKGTQYKTSAGPIVRTVWTKLDADSGIEFGWKGIPGGDWFEFIAILEEKSTAAGDHKIVDSVWIREPQMEWQQTVFSNKDAGEYRVSFLLASFDGSGGGYLGASLAVRNFMVKLKNQCSVGPGVLPVATKASEFCRCGDRGAMCGSTAGAKRACMDCGEKQCLVKNDADSGA